MESLEIELEKIENLKRDLSATIYIPSGLEWTGRNLTKEERGSRYDQSDADGKSIWVSGHEGGPDFELQENAREKLGKVYFDSIGNEEYSEAVIEAGRALGYDDHRIKRDIFRKKHPVAVPVTESLIALGTLAVVSRIGYLISEYATKYLLKP